MASKAYRMPEEIQLPPILKCSRNCMKVCGKSGVGWGGTAGGTRTPNTRFWRPMLYQLNYCRFEANWGHSVFSEVPRDSLGPARRSGREREPVLLEDDYLRISPTRPAPTVRPPSRMAKRMVGSMAIGVISSTSRFTLSPGITISTPSGSLMLPVTSVVRK